MQIKTVDMSLNMIVKDKQMIKLNKYQIVSYMRIYRQTVLTCFNKLHFSGRLFH